jgi:GH25 family lysozyme M1 (1,4-beta-N-acetylmuramidase)
MPGLNKADYHFGKSAFYAGRAAAQTKNNPPMQETCMRGKLKGGVMKKRILLIIAGQY